MNSFSNFFVAPLGSEAQAMKPQDVCSPSFQKSIPGLSQSLKPEIDKWIHKDEGPSRIDRDALFSEFGPLVRRLLSQYAKDAELRQDMLGEIYFRFCSLLEAYDPSRNVPVRAYLVRQLSASIYTYARQQWRHQEREFSTDDISGCFSDLTEDPTGSWDDALLLRDFSQALPALLSQLPPRQAKVIIWRYYDEVSFEEIAERLEVKTATARSLLRHGLNQLRRHFAASSFSESSSIID